MQFLGELAALSTAGLWAFTSICFSQAGNRIGAFRVNKIRLLFAVVVYTVVLWLTTGSPIPPAVGREPLFWLCLSSLIGLVIGDSLLFKAFVTLGPRLTTLIFASSPIMATVIAWIFLDEKLGLLDLVGIAVTMAGITWVVAERGTNGAPKLDSDHPDHAPFWVGVLLALGGSLGQAAGLVTSKQGMLHAGEVVNPFIASFIRILFAAVVIWLFAAVTGQLTRIKDAFRHRPAMLYTLGGTIVGPFLGIWMSLVAVSLIAAGIAATLNAMVPVLVIPLVILFYKEKVSARAIIGAFVAVAGVALIFLF
jgi:drug/metabolite transporter (DMT)-like permease